MYGPDDDHVYGAGYDVRYILLWIGLWSVLLREAGIERNRNEIVMWKGSDCCRTLFCAHSHQCEKLYMKWNVMEIKLN